MDLQAVASICAGALCAAAVTPLGVQAIHRHGAVWAVAGYLAKSFAAATSTPETRVKLLRQAPTQLLPPPILLYLLFTDLILQIVLFYLP
eukprot:scaffold189467_cov15-Prasinocladus_malaysianus.AAC.1